jgi:NAD(P)H-hydrate epimerase
VRQIIHVVKTPLVLDADALFAVGQEPEMLRSAAAPLILTPHEGEFRALGAPSPTTGLGDTRRFAREYGCSLILKGHHTIAAFPDGETAVCPYGNPGMAKGGSGDVLAGILGRHALSAAAERRREGRVGHPRRAGDLAAAQLGILHDALGYD